MSCEQRIGGIGETVTTKHVSDFIRNCFAVASDKDALTDEQLLVNYIKGHDTNAIEQLVRRHAAMVWSVCQRVLHNKQDAEDAFQATFLVFIRRASSIAAPELLANWLYGVARQTALKARATSAVRRHREHLVSDIPEATVDGRKLERHLDSVLDEELSRLASHYRTVVVLCDLEGITREEAAHRLQLPIGTVASRLARGRGILAKRLTRRGMALPAGALAMTMPQAMAVPPALLTATISAVVNITAGQPLGLVVTAATLQLTERVIKTMVVSKLKAVAAVLMTLVACGSVGLIARMPADQPSVRYSSPVTTDVREVSVRLEPPQGGTTGREVGLNLSTRQRDEKMSKAIAAVLQYVLASEDRSKAAAQAYKKLFMDIGPAGIVKLAEDEDTSIALQANWELCRKAIKRNPPILHRADWVFDEKLIGDFLKVVAKHLHSDPPVWWATTLLKGEIFPGQHHAFIDIKQPLPPIATVSTDKNNVVLTTGKFSLTIDRTDFSNGNDPRLGTGPVVLYGTDMSFVGKPVFRAYPFELFGVDTRTGRKVWTATVWAARRGMSTGPDGLNPVEICRQGDTIIVYGCESHGLYAEGFDAKTGKCRFRFCTCYWFNHPETWGLR